MSEETKNNDKSEGQGTKSKAMKFRMAYSLNNSQPVQCTLVSDQPFFYMDEECDLDDDAILSDEFLDEYDMLSDETLIAEMTSLKKKMEAYDRFSDTQPKETNQRLNEFLIDSEMFSEKQTINSEKEDLEKIKSILSKSRMGQELIEFSSKNNIAIEYSAQVQTAFYDKKESKIFIRPDLDLKDQVLLLAQELRRYWQDAHGAMINPLSLHPDQAVLVHRAQRADLAVAIIRCAWEIKLQGEQDIWSRVERSSLSDLGRAFAREALSDFRTLNDGKASSAVFETWFLSERCRNEDKKLIQAMLADYRGYIFDNVDLSRNVSLELICKLGEQPFGKNYLAPYAQMIMNDSLFTEVRDRSNANFLWFIKFERTFQETEQELQPSELIQMTGADLSDNKNIFEDNQNETGLNDSEKPLFSNEQCLVDYEKSGRGNVIEVQFGCSR